MPAENPGPTVAAGRRIRPQEETPSPVLAIGRGTAVAAGLVFALLSAWSAVSAWYLVTRDDLAAALLARQAEIQETYEERVAALRARLDRVTSQKLLEQDSLEGRLAGVVSRQAHIETRQAVLSALVEGAGSPTGTLRAPGQPPSLATASSSLPGAATARTGDLPGPARAFAPSKPVPEQEPDPFPLRLRSSGAGLTGLPAGALLPTTPSVGERPADLLARVERSLGAVEAQQVRQLEVHLASVRERAGRLRTAIARVGLNPDGVKAPAPDGVGGPYLPVRVDPKAGPFEALAGEVKASLVTLERLKRVTAALPLARPVAGDPDVSSGFGMRLDPFTRSPALHAGLDFRAEPGVPVRAAGAGRVVTAEPSGGYGNLVEIDHGHGVATRYAHLSAIAVIPGQTVAAGAVVGRVGSTGRSTGPHLHYETRINDEPVDPQRFLRAGALLFAAGDP